MHTTNIRLIRALGSVVLARLANETISKSFQPRVDAFTAANEDFQKASQEVDAANAERLKGSRAIKAACVVVEASVEALADDMVTAKIGSRSKPFASYSTLVVSKTTRGAYSNRVDNVRTLVRELRAKGKLPVAVDRACDTALGAADQLAEAILAASAPAGTYRKALLRREPIAEAWLETFNRFKDAAKVHWENDPATFTILFAPPEKVVMPVKPRKAKKAAAPAPTTTPSSATPAS